MTGLFRQQVIDSQTHRLEGAISLAQPMSLKLTVLLLFTISVAAIVFVFNAHYSRKESVQGFLRPDKGVIKIYPTRDGSVEHIYVQVGDTVTEGAPLLSIVSHAETTTGEELSEELLSELVLQVKLLEEELQQSKQLETKELNRISNRILAIVEDQKMLRTSERFSREKLKLLSSQTENYARLYERGYISELDYRLKTGLLLDARQAAIVNSRALMAQQEKFEQLSFEKNRLPEKYKSAYREIAHKKSVLKRSIIETKTRYRKIIKSSQSGVVASIFMVEGESVSARRPLLKILPEGSRLVAELLLPTRSAGLVETGDEVLLRLDAFPHQRFGFLTSKVIRIDKALVMPEELELPIRLQESVYKILARLDSQFIQGYERKFPLKNGMLLQADIILDRRPLIEWMLDPVYKLKNTLH